jgi:uncharacterized metal-binding protein YceD (DUF177 family)
MQEVFNIYIDRLSEGSIEKIDESISGDFLELTDGNLFFPENIDFQGKAYLADSHLILTLDISTQYQTYCKICNELITLPFTLEGLYITEEIGNIPSKVFNLKESIRDAILLEIPLYSECEGGCPMRKDLNQYFKQESYSTIKEI